ncbi:MAG: universal stress protein [Nitrosopumilaceae archaeon]|uniref:Universal stress protein n=1 Tax=Candidatus Nitrosomaritimum aestuariumsis TaxID=3342354 RepID=A0AC60WA39_9ARCH|nr:universal stress protein [Nitrosopumilaceae archaeon]MBA4461141.1 universal stress protein [Nitrosopumilaceae archaeon]MBA4463820.1 universal stress protein [Nitrosopumilaceae archaeon]
MNILVPLDGSDYSKKALLQACDMAKNYQANLILVYVVDKTRSLNLLDKNEYLKMLRKFGEKVLIKGKETAQTKGMDVTTIMKEGNVTNEIVKLAKNKKCNLIIVGSKGLGATARFFLGSVSNKLANNSPCSVLIVK